MRKLQFPGLSAVVLIQAAMLVACQPDDILRPSAKQATTPRFNSVLGDHGLLPVSSTTNPSFAVQLTTYAHRTAVSVLLSGTINMSSNPSGSWYSNYSGPLDGAGIYVNGVYDSCYATVSIRTNGTLHRAPGGCATSPTPQGEWADTIIANGEGSIFRSAGVPLTATEKSDGCGPYGGEICYEYSGFQAYSISRVPADLELTGRPVFEPGTSITDTAEVSPQWVAAKKIPFVVQRWRWFRGDSVPTVPYPPHLTNPSGCTPPAAVDTNPALCTIASDKSGVLEIDAIVNGVPETLRKNISVVAGGRACEKPVLKLWGRVSSRFQVKEKIRNFKKHRGMDTAVPESTEVYSAEAGTVVDAGEGPTAGIRVIVRGNYMSYYYHLAGRAPGIHVGAMVFAGTLLGYSGDTGANSTGPHLHFQQHTLGPIWDERDLPPADTEVEPCYF